ncbi:MAG: secretin N-terminal domain-containing protein [Thermoanaerobaculum sp.]
MRWLGALAFSVAAASACWAQASQEVRVFQLRFKPAREAAAVVEPLLSPEGSLLIQPKANTLTVRDTPAVQKQVAEALAAFDVPPEAFRIRLRLILASTAPPTPGAAAPLIEGVGRELAEVFRFTSYQELDTLVLAATDGATVEAQAGGRYLVRFVVRGASRDRDRVQLSGFELYRKTRSADGSDALHLILRTTLSLRLQQTAVVGAARSESAKEALVLVFWAEREEP